MNKAKIKKVMTMDEVEKRYKYELANDMINTSDTPHYDSLNEFAYMLEDEGVKIKGRKRKRK